MVVRPRLTGESWRRISHGARTVAVTPTIVCRIAAPTRTAAATESEVASLCLLPSVLHDAVSCVLQLVWCFTDACLPSASGVRLTTPASV